MKGRWKRAVDMPTLLSMFVLMYSGIVLSRHVFTFLPIESGLFQRNGTPS